jgi:serine/threonine-protein kinase
MNKRLIRRISIVAAICIVVPMFLYYLFNWTMGSVVHSRKDVTIPDLRGKTLETALSEVSPMNLGLKKEGEEPDQSLPPGTIIRQNPPAGMNVKEGKIIRVTISQGGKVVYVPNVVGQTVRSAEISIRSAGFTLGEVSSRFSLLNKKDYVLSQDPSPEATAEKDSMVNLVVSAGPPPDNVKLMPDWAGKNVGEAKQWAERNFVNLDVREEKSDGSQPGAVIRQEPAPDTDITSARSAAITVASSDSSPVYLPAKTFYYEIPQGEGERQVRMTLLDENGEREIFQGVKTPGSKIDVPIKPKGHARVRVFINSILVEERDVK